MKGCNSETIHVFARSVTMSEVHKEELNWVNRGWATAAASAMGATGAE